MQIVRLSLIGGKTLGDVVSGVLRYLLAVNLQREFNWYGKKGKREFGKLALAGIVYSTKYHLPFIFVSICRGLYTI